MQTPAQPAQADRPHYCHECNLRTYPAEKLEKYNGRWVHDHCSQRARYKAEHDLNDLMKQIDRIEAQPGRRAMMRWYAAR